MKHVTSSKTEVFMDLPDIGDIAPGGIVPAAIADINRMLADQHLEPTASNWIAMCDHFLSQSLISPGFATAYRLLRAGILRSALSMVVIRTSAISDDVCPDNCDHKYNTACALSCYSDDDRYRSMTWYDQD